MIRKINNNKFQQGMAMLLVLLVLISASAYKLVGELNEAGKTSTRQQQSSDALSQAKEVLLSYAATYPDRVNENFGPGYLPCPDRNNNGIVGRGSKGGGPCSSKTNTTTGRLPWVTLKINDLRDSSGQRLWYVLSDNFRNSPKLEPLNSETPGQLSLDKDGDSNIDEDDIVAIIIAPGEPVKKTTGGVQNRNPGEVIIANEITEYLEGENTNFDEYFVSSTTNGVNDRLIYITRSELIEQIESRALGEIKRSFKRYFDTHGAYPWLSGFADPKTNEKRLTGNHKSADNQTVLKDTTRDYIQWGVSVGDRVWNVTDGSYGIVSAVLDEHRLELNSSGLSFGIDNDFDEGDEYFIDISTYPDMFVGTSTAKAGSQGLVLKDGQVNFTHLNVRVGDIVENLSYGTSGIIEIVAATKLIVSPSTAGRFNPGDVYRIRSSNGRVTDTESEGLTLEDPRVNFLVMGIQQGDLIQNRTDGSYGRVTAVESNKITVAELNFGTNNKFAVGDYYSLPRFNPIEGISSGLLPIHDIGEPFNTSLDFEWTFSANDADITVNSEVLEAYIENYLSGNEKSIDDAICIWLKLNTVDCFARYTTFFNIDGYNSPTPNLPPHNSSILMDSQAVFQTDKIQEGDIVQIYDDDNADQVASGIINPISGIAGGGSNNTTLIDNTVDFTSLPITVGDTVTNLVDQSSGTIRAIGTNQITVDSLSGGIHNNFFSGNVYQIVYSSTRVFDSSADFSNYPRYAHVIRNLTYEAFAVSTGGAIPAPAVLSKVISPVVLETESYGDANLPELKFKPFDNYQIMKPRRFVINQVNSENMAEVRPYVNAATADFSERNYYRIMQASNSIQGTVESVVSNGSSDKITDSAGDFITAGVKVGDVVKNHDGAYGEITAVTSTTITTKLFSGGSNDFNTGSSYTIFHDYVHQRDHVLHARFSGKETIDTVAEERKRNVCVGYSADCTVKTAVAFSGNGGTDLATINDFEEDGTTNVATATFRPSNLSSGSLLVGNIDLYLNSETGDFPSWFVKNDWHKLSYFSMSSGDKPAAAVDCAAGTNCLSVYIAKPSGSAVNENVNALIVLAGAATKKNLDASCATLISSEQDRTNGTINEYFEAENCDQNDDVFQKSGKKMNYNDRLIIVNDSP